MGYNSKVLVIEDLRFSFTLIIFTVVSEYKMLEYKKGKYFSVIGFIEIEV